MPTSTSCRAALRLRDAGMPHPGGPPTVCYGNVDGKKHFSPLCHLLLLQQPLRALAKRAAGSVAQSTTSHHRSRVLVDALSQVQAPTTRALLRVACGGFAWQYAASCSDARPPANSDTQATYCAKTLGRCDTRRCANRTGCCTRSLLHSLAAFPAQ